MKPLPLVGELSREDNNEWRLTEHVCDNEECKHIEASKWMNNDSRISS